MGNTKTKSTHEVDSIFTYISGSGMNGHEAVNGTSVNPQALVNIFAREPAPNGDPAPSRPKRKRDLL